jgi:hypothetical protein
MGAGPSKGSDANYVVHPRRTLIALGLSLVGFLGVAFLLYALKFLGVGATVHGVPSRDLFVVSLMLAATPLLLAIFHRPIWWFALPPIVLVFLLYPFFSPFGIPYSRDAVFDFQVASLVLQSGHWAPNAGETLQAVAYSYYPASAVFNAELASFTGLPLSSTFQWGEPVLRLLMIPPAVYVLGNRYFGPRVAAVSLLLYLGVPSILFNLPVQTEFAVPFFALALMLLGYLTAKESAEFPGLLWALVLVASFVVVSHHLSSYVLLAWLAGLAVLFLLFRSLPRGHSRNAWWAIGAYFAFFVVYTFGVSLSDFLSNYTALTVVANSFVHPSTLANSATTVGASFPLYQQAWTYLAYLLLIVISLLALRSLLRTSARATVGPNLIVGIVAVLVTLPLLATAFNFLALRFMEYGGLVMVGPFAWWTLRRLSPAIRGRDRSSASDPPGPRASSLRRFAASATTIALVVLVFTGGSLVPYSTRDQFATASALTTDSPLHIDDNSYQLAIWAHGHLTSSSTVWGDNLAYSVFGGFGRFSMVYDQYQLYNGTSIPSAVWAQVSVGSYVVIDKYMTETIPSFPGPSNDQPTTPLTPGQLAKFNDPAFFDAVYQDSTFTVYEVIAKG